MGESQISDPEQLKFERQRTISDAGLLHDEERLKVDGEDRETGGYVYDVDQKTGNKIKQPRLEVEKRLTGPNAELILRWENKLSGKDIPSLIIKYLDGSSANQSEKKDGGELISELAADGLQFIVNTYDGSVYLGKEGSGSSVLVGHAYYSEGEFFHDLSNTKGRFDDKGMQRIAPWLLLTDGAAR